MKSTLVILSLVLLGASLAVGQPTSSETGQKSKEEQEVLQREQEWNEAYKNRDEEALKRILADEFIFTDDEGQVYNKAQYIDAATQVIKVEAYSLDDIAIRVYDNTGILTVRGTYKMTINGKEAGGVFRSTDIFLKRQGSWQAVASQDTRAWRVVPPLLSLRTLPTTDCRN